MSKLIAHVSAPPAAAHQQGHAIGLPDSYSADGYRDDVHNEAGGNIPIGQLMKLNLGSDGDITAFPELRTPGRCPFPKGIGPLAFGPAQSVLRDRVVMHSCGGGRLPNTTLNHVNERVTI